MSGIEAWAATTLFTVGSTAVTYGALAKTALVVGLAADTRRKQRKARRRALDAIEDRTQMVRTATLDRPRVFGEVKLSGVFYPLGESGPDGERFHFQVLLAGAVDGIEAVYFGSERITEWDADGWVTQAPYGKTVNEPTGEWPTITVGGKAALSRQVDSLLSIALPPEDSNVPMQLREGDPLTDVLAYSVATAGGVTVITVHASHIGKTLYVNYLWEHTKSYLRVKFHDGQPGQVADPYLMSELPTRWTSDCVGNDIAHLSVTMVYSPDVFPHGIEDVSAVIRGERVFDPRTSTTVYTKNNALIARNLLMTELRCTTDEIGASPLNAAANGCDEAVSTDDDTTEARYEFCGVLSTELSSIEMLEHVLDSMMGYAVYTGGTWNVYAGVWREPTLALTEQDLANADIVTQSRQGVEDLVNCARARYCNDDFVVTDAPPFESPTYIAEDNGEKGYLDLDLQFVRSVHRAQRIEKRSVLQARQAMTFTASWKLGGYEVVPGDIVELTIPVNTWDEKAFLCVDRDYDTMGGVELSLREVAEAIDDWDFDEATNPDPAPNSNFPNLRVVEAPTLTFASGTQFVTLLEDGSQAPFLRVYWQEYDATVETVEIMWRRAHEANFREPKFEPAEKGSHDIYGIAATGVHIVWARAINGLGVRSPWSAYKVEVDATAPANGGAMRLGIGVNQCENATLRNTAAGWRFEVAATAYDFSDQLQTVVAGSRTFQIQRVGEGLSVEPFRPRPYGALRVNQSLGPAESFNAIIYRARPMPVRPGDRVEAQVRVGGYLAASANLVLAFYDVNDAVVSVVALDGNAALLPSEVYNGIGSHEGSYYGWQELKSFKLLYGFATAPANAAGARQVLFLNRHAATGSSAIVMAMPYIGLSRVGQDEPSIWGPGPAGGAVESLEAVTEVISDVDPMHVVSVDGMTIFSQTFTPPLDGDVEISASSAISATLISSGGVSKGWIGLSIDLYRGTTGGTIMEQGRSSVIGWAADEIGITRYGQAALVVTAEVEAGQLYTVVVAVNDDALKFSGVTATDTRLRVTEVYR